MIKTFKGSDLQMTILLAKEDLKTDNFYYVIVSENNSEECIINTYFLEDVAEFGNNFLKKCFDSLNVDSEITYEIDQEKKIINFHVNSSRNSILIGTSGKTLKAFSIFLLTSVSNKFKKKFRIFLDIGNYRNKIFSKVIIMGRKAAKEAINRKCSIRLEPMTIDERKAVYQSLADIKDITTESIGEDENNKYIIIHSNESDKKNILHYKDVFENQQENYKNEFSRYKKNSFNEFFYKKDNPDEKNNDNGSFFTNLSFLKNDKDK